MSDEKKSNLHLIDNSEKGDPCKHLLNNYIYFIDKIFKHPKTNINCILKNDKKDANLFAYDREKRVEKLTIKGQSLKNEIDQNPFGHTVKDLYQLTHVTNLKDGDQLLKQNAFYIYAQELLICLHHASRNYFFASMKQQCGYCPNKIRHVEYVVLKILNVLTFLVSSYTTGYGVNHLLQKNSLAILSSFNGDEGEVPRLIVSFMGGIFLSVIIFHLKSSLFKGILSAGKIFEGLKRTYLKYPWKIIFAVFVLSLSIKTNYDGGVALISKSEYINEQYKLISRYAFAAYNSNISDKNADSSFYQSVISLKQITKDILEKFKKFPLEEDDGIASSGFAGQGPRYRGKNFVIEGGYYKSKNGVSQYFKNQELANEVDAIILSSGMDFSQSLETKLKLLISNYENSVLNQKNQVETRILELENQVKSVDSYLPKFVSMSFVEYYDLDRIVKEIAKSFVLNAKQYDDTVTMLKSTIDQHIQVLSRIDRAGKARSRNYHITVTFPSINVSDILALTRGLPEVKYLSFEELISLIKSQYGLMWAQIVMLFILVMSVLIDLADVIFMSTTLANRGRRELEMIPSKEDELNDWEEKFLKQCYLFLYDDDVAQVHNQLIPSKSILLVDAFYQLLEEVNPMVIDPSDKRLSTNILDHLKSDFNPLHAHPTNVYNERVKAIEIITKNPELYLNRYLDIIFPFLKDTLLQTDFSFDEIDKRVQTKQSHVLNKILVRVENLSREDETPSFYNYFRTERLVKKLKRMDEKIGQQLEQFDDDTNMADLMDYNVLRRDNLKKNQKYIQKELARTTYELNELKVRTRNYLIGDSGGRGSGGYTDSVELSNLTIRWKMIMSFFSSFVSFWKEENFASKILSRRKWLLSMGHRIVKPQSMDIEQPSNQNSKLSKAA